MGTVVFLSPHLDDAIFSCAGLIQESVEQNHDVEIITVFSRNMPERRNEDIKATSILNCRPRWLDFQDAPARRGRPEVLFQYLSDDMKTIDEIEKVFLKIKKDLLPGTIVYAPLGVGWHIDHLIAHEAAVRVFSKADLRFYEDSPYRNVKFQTDIRIGTQNEETIELFIASFFNANYVKTYLNDWTPEILRNKLNGYLDLKVSSRIQDIHQVVLTNLMQDRSHIAKTQYSSQSPFYDKETEPKFEKYYMVLR